MTYTKYMHGICHTYTSLSDLSVLTAFNEAINVGWIGNACTQHGISGQLLDSTQKAWFTVRQDMQGIIPVYTMYILCIYHAKVTCEPSSLPIRAWKPQTGTSVGASQFWPQRGRPREAGAVQSSTTRCWSRKHGCPSVSLGPHHRHSRTLTWKCPYVGCQCCTYVE